jgi:hypothetical protein
VLRQIKDAGWALRENAAAANYCAANRRIGTEYLPLPLNM